MENNDIAKSLLGLLAKNSGVGRRASCFPPWMGQMEAWFCKREVVEIGLKFLVSNMHLSKVLELGIFKMADRIF